MKQETVLSVLIITYNQQEYISQAIDSILEQNITVPYEIVIGEDCSTDDTPKILERYAGEYPGVVKPIYNCENLGLIGNYFNTLKHCSGEYLAVCGGDDRWLPGKANKQMDFLNHNPEYGLVYGQAECYFQDEPNRTGKMIGSQSLSFDRLVMGNNIPACTVMMRMEAVHEYIRRIEPQNRDWMMEDYPMWLWIIGNYKVKYMDEVVAVYRVLAHSLSHFTNIDKELAFKISAFDLAFFFCRYFDRKDLEQKMASRNLNSIASTLLKVKNPPSGKLKEITRKYGIRSGRICLLNLLYSTSVGRNLLRKKWHINVNK